MNYHSGPSDSDIDGHELKSRRAVAAAAGYIDLEEQRQTIRAIQTCVPLDPGIILMLVNYAWRGRSWSTIPKSDAETTIKYLKNNQCRWQELLEAGPPTGPGKAPPDDEHGDWRSD